MALGSTQPLVKMSTMNIPGGKGGRCVRLTTYHHTVPLSRNLGALTLLDHSGPAWPVTGVLYLYLYKCYKQYSSNEHHTTLSVKHRYTRRNTKKNGLTSKRSDKHTKTTGKTRKQFPVNLQAVEKSSVNILVIQSPLLKSTLSQLVPATSCTPHLSSSSHLTQ